MAKLQIVLEASEVHTILIAHIRKMYNIPSNQLISLQGFTVGLDGVCCMVDAPNITPRNIFDDLADGV